MCKRNNDALFFTCSLIEQLGRSLHMRRGKVAAELGEAGIQTLYRNADILHCEPIEKVADDVITEFSLQGGDFDNLAEASYNAAFYYQPRDYIAECYRQKTVLDG